MSTEISLERPVSALSASSTTSDMDWDRSNGSISVATVPITPSPSPRRRRVELPPESTPLPNRQRSLAHLLRIHAENGPGEEVVICPEEERRLKEALDNWVSWSFALPFISFLVHPLFLSFFGGWWGARMGLLINLFRSTRR